MCKHFFYIIFLVANFSFADVILPSMFSDHMVLQQNDEVKFWGWAEPKEDVVIKPSWSNNEYTIKTNNHANWELTVKTPKAGGPYTIEINGYNEIIIKDVLIGEVWLCSGQSNMEMSASWEGGITNGEEEAQMANHPNIRFLTVPKISADYPQNNVPSKWNVCTPETMKHNSALAYFFAQKMQSQLPNVPIGLVISAWGSTPAEVWIPEEIINNNQTLLDCASKLQSNEWSPIKTASAFNGMINPIVGYNIAGVLWYQGESNVGSHNYDQTFSTLINTWRTLWKNNFPFYYVQISPYNYGEDQFSGVIIRDAQRKVLKVIEKTGMVVTSDISTIDDIHPKDKKSVGIRLANLALKNQYNVINNLVESPEFEKATFNKKNAVVHFKYADGLYLKDNISLFEIAGEDGKFYFAKCKLKDETVIVSSNKVKSPKYVRFAWGNELQSNLFNKADLPASSFEAE